MSRLVTSLLAAIVILALVVAAYVVVERGEGSGDEREEATARGLAAGVVAHLGGSTPTSVSGWSSAGYLTVSLETDDPALTTVFVSVSAHDASRTMPCGAVAGPYHVEVSCTRDPFRDLSRRQGTNPDTASWVGVVDDVARGLVMVQVFGDGGARGRQLVEGVLDDPLVGLRTSAGRNEAGRDLDGFGPARTETYGSLEATPRGLAVAVIDHLDGRTVTSVAATGQGGLAVVVETDDPAVASVSVFVEHVDPVGPDESPPCGLDDGFREVSCVTGPLREVVSRAPGRGGAPTFIGRAHDTFRGDVLIEVHGDSDAPEVAALVQSLVDDDAVGTFGSDENNARGLDLDVDPLSFEESLERVG